MHNHMAAIPYRVTKTFIFRGVVYEPGSVFDPVEAQCVPHKLVAFVRQRILTVDGPDLQESLQKDTTKAPKGSKTQKTASTTAQSDDKTEDDQNGLDVDSSKKKSGRRSGRRS